MTTTPQEHTADLDSGFPIHDTVGAWVPHGRFVIPPTAHGLLDGLRFAVKDVFDVAGHPTGAGNPTWLATHPIPERSSPLVDITAPPSTYAPLGGFRAGLRADRLPQCPPG